MSKNKPAKVIGAGADPAINWVEIIKGMRDKVLCQLATPDSMVVSQE